MNSENKVSEIAKTYELGERAIAESQAPEPTWEQKREAYKELQSKYPSMKDEWQAFFEGTTFMEKWSAESQVQPESKE